MKLESQCIHAGYEPKNGEPCALPIAQSTTFRYTSTAEVAKLFDLTEAGFFYSRLGNPTVDGAQVTAEALEIFRAPKVVAFKKKRRKGYHRTVGHRQDLLRVKITAIA